MPTLLPLPPSAGKMKPSPKLQWFCKWLLARLGWSMQGQWPDLKKVVIIGAPHSSAWDVVLVLLVIQATGMKVVFMGKQEVFRMPIVGSISRYLGGMPVNRAAPGGVIEQVAEQIRNAEQMWFALAPEGTRKEVKEWKTGFWKIAKKANVPVCCAYFHFPDKVIGVGQVFELSDDMDADIAKIRAWYKPYQGRNRGV
jgi:1-acyl-sn-glycerol-3-phosphate acyltransferase